MANILWIDDYAGKGGQRRMGFDGLVFFMEQKGHKVDIASSHDEIENALKTIEGYALVILDIIMEPLPPTRAQDNQYGGIYLLEQIAAARPGLPIIVLSVMQKRLLVEEVNRRGLDLQDLGVVEVLRKGSVTPTQLAELVERNLPSHIESHAGV